MSSQGKDLKSITVVAHALALTSAVAAGSGDATEVDGVTFDLSSATYKRPVHCGRQGDADHGQDPDRDRQSARFGERQ